MKKSLFAIAMVIFGIAVHAQTIQGSWRKNADAGALDVLFKSNYNSLSGEYINYLQFSVAIPQTLADGITATATGKNVFANMGLIEQASPYTEGTQRIFTWVFANPGKTIQSWKSDTEFVGVLVNFTGPNADAAAAEAKLVDFSGTGGGGNTNTYFGIVSSSGDRTNYPRLFYHGTGITEIAAPKINVSPNPSNNHFDLKLNTGSDSDITIRIIDVSGKVVETVSGSASRTFHVGDKLLPGVYTAEFSQGDYKGKVKLVKQQ